MKGKGQSGWIAVRVKVEEHDRNVMKMSTEEEDLVVMKVTEKNVYTSYFERTQ